MINIVIRNLISNSLKFKKNNVTITIIYKDLDNFHHIDIIDDGVGKSKNVLNKLFKIDEHVTTLGTNQETGTGVVLILCKELVNKNKGNIIVESELGKNTKFTMIIPKNLKKSFAPQLN